MTRLSQLDDSVRLVLSNAQDEARSLGHGYIGTEHLVVALLAVSVAPVVKRARRLGASAEAARRHAEVVFAATDNAYAYVPDEDALAAVGVDLTEVRRRAEAAFGPGAVPMRVGAPSFTPRAMFSLDHGFERATARGSDLASDADVFAAILQDEASEGSKALIAMCGGMNLIVGDDEPLQQLD